jgi:hypothetical protein
MKIHVLQHTVQLLNLTVQPNGVSDNLSPSSIVLGTQRDTNVHCRLEFGTYCQLGCQVRELRLTSLSATSNERTLKASWNRLTRNRGRGETAQSPDGGMDTHRGGRVTFIYEG